GAERPAEPPLVPGEAVRVERPGQVPPRIGAGRIGAAVGPCRSAIARYLQSGRQQGGSPPRAQLQRGNSEIFFTARAWARCRRWCAMVAATQAAALSLSQPAPCAAEGTLIRSSRTPSAMS